MNTETGTPIYTCPKTQTLLRPALQTDVAQLMQLNRKWQKHQLPHTENGFLSVAYEQSFF